MKRQKIKFPDQKRYTLEINNHGFTLWDDMTKQWIIDGSEFNNDKSVRIAKKQFKLVDIHKVIPYHTFLIRSKS